jgi:Transcriptional activator, adenine-specific DNA methyltransferase
VTALAQYDAACVALAAAVKADEVMHVRLEADGLRALARVAKNVEMEAQAVALRTRAEARLGEMLIEGERQGAIAKHGQRRRDSDPESLNRATLKEIGIDPKLSARARKLSGIGAQAVDAMLSRMERESRERGKVAINVIDAELSARNSESRRNLARELSEAAAALSPSGRMFPICYADPAWRRKAGLGDRAYENHYDTMTWDEILAMPVAQRMLPDAWLFLWIPRAHLLALHPVEIETALGKITIKLPLAWAVARAWGFDDYSTCNIWHKVEDWQGDAHGTGLIFWDQDEVLCLFKRGRGLPMPDGATKFNSSYCEAPKEHSAKPTFYREMINAMSGGLPVLELFAREDKEHVLPTNFYTWGNQSKNTADLQSHDPSTGEIIEYTEPSTNSESSSGVARQSEAPLAGTGSETSAVCEGDQKAGAQMLPPPIQEDHPGIPAFLRRDADNALPEVAS